MPEIEPPREAGDHGLMLGTDDWCENPASTKRKLYGPMRLRLTNWPSRGRTLTVLGGEE